MSGTAIRAVVEYLVQDVRVALRGLSRDATFTLVAAGMLALGIGATVTVFAVVHAVLLRPLPFPDPDRLVMVWERTPRGSDRNPVNTPNFVDWRARNRAFAHIGLIGWAPMNVTGNGDAEQVDGLRVTAEFFDALGRPALIGRTIRSGEDVAGGPQTAVLSYRFWQQRYGGATDVLGRLLTINGVPHEIVGVMPATFAFPAARAAELYSALQLDLSQLPQGRSLFTVARLKPEASMDLAQTDMQRVAAEIEHLRPANQGYSATVVPLLDQAVGDTRRILWVLFGAVACLLALACANIANLTLMRASSRESEFAVRLALGAGRWRLMRQLLVESLVLGVMGGAVGLLLAWVVVPLVPTLFSSTFPLPRAHEIALDWTVVAFAIAVSMTVSVLFGLFPAWQLRPRAVAAPLRGSGRTIAGSHARVRRALVVVEVALALIIAVAAGLVGRSLTALYRVDTGMQAAQVLTLRMLMLPTKYREPAARVRFLDRVLQEVRGTPGVTSASSVHFLPLSGINSQSLFYRSDRPRPERSTAPGVDVSLVTPDYFRTMGVPLREGRDFGAADRIDARRVVIVNETLARQVFAGEAALGRHLGIWWSTPEPHDYEIVGIAADVRATALDKTVGPAVYIPQMQETSALATLVVRTAVPPVSAVAAVRAAIARVDAEQGVSEVRPMRAVIASQTTRPEVEASVLGGFGALALIVAAIGLYGVMAYAVAQRRREMGLRMALGAAPSSLLQLVLKEGVVLTLAGIGVGIVAALAGSSLLRGVLFDTPPTDPPTFIGVGVTLLVVAIVASLAPARRATRIDPIVVLRDQ